MIDRYAARAWMVGLIVAFSGSEAQAQATATVGENPPPGYEESLADPAERPQTLGRRNFRDLAELTDGELTNEVQQLTAERDERVRRMTEWQEKVRELDARLQRTTNERDRKPLLYDRARVNYVAQELRHQVQLISERLEEIAKERVRRRGGEPSAAADPEAPVNLVQMRRAVHLMNQYDDELRKILSRDPVTELDLIEALTLLKRREVLTEAFDDYFTAIAKREADAEASGDAGE